MASAENSQGQLNRQNVELVDCVPEDGRGTLLPAPLASLVSLATQSTSASLRFGTLIGSLALNGARASTLTSLELGRGMVDSILSPAGNDVSDHSRSPHSSEEADRLLQRSTALFHTSLTHASLLVSTGFLLSSSILSVASNTFQHLLFTLESILGDTETSKAIAAIVHLIRQEFRNPETGVNGERVGLGDLLVGLIAFALLQRWGRKTTEQQLRESGGLEVLWDVVILDDGTRADVITANKAGPGVQEATVGPGDQHRSNKGPQDASKRSSFISVTGEADTVEVIERRHSVPAAEVPSALSSLEGRWPESEISHLLAKQLPDNANVLINTEETINKTITMDISGGELPDISPPPGVTILEENIESDLSRTAEDLNHPNTAPISMSRYKVVFQSTQNRVWSSTPIAQPYLNASVASAEETQAEPRLRTIEGSTLLTPVLNPPALVEGPEKLKFAGGKLSTAQELPVKTSLRHALKKKATPKANLASLWRRDTKRPTTKEDTLSIPKRARTSSEGLPRSERGGALRGDSDPMAAVNYAGESGNYVRPSTPPNMYPARERHRSSVSPQANVKTQHPTQAVKSGGSPKHTPMPRIIDETTEPKPGANADPKPTPPPSSPVRHHRRSSSRATSIYTIESNNSELSLWLYRSGSNEDDDLAGFGGSLLRGGHVPGLFPHSHLVRNLTRFARFSSASYGSSFLKIMGIANANTAAQLKADELHHHEHRSFSSHTRLPSSTILLSSFVDPQGGSNSSGKTGTEVPLVHYLSVDHESKAVVLTCRGTLGFEDILTDMKCDYDKLVWGGKPYRVHKGMHASARRLLEGGGGRVMEAIKGALNEFQDYGVVMCGHSLGGGVAALLALLISEPDATASSGSAFVTVSPLQRPPLRLTASRSGPGSALVEPLWLPSGRPIHVYAYGPPATLSSSLQRTTRGLITTVVNGQDIIPSLSLGTLHDFQAVALAFKTDTSNAKAEVRNRVWEGLAGKARGRPISLANERGGDYWVWSALKSLRAAMLSPKLVPPGRVYTVETQSVLQRDAFVPRETGSGNDLPNLGRPATRVVLTRVKNVETRFGELRFGSEMFGDHSPGRYETSLEALEKGVLDE